MQMWTKTAAHSKEIILAKCLWWLGKWKWAIDISIETCRKIPQCLYHIHHYILYISYTTHIPDSTYTTIYHLCLPSLSVWEEEWASGCWRGAFVCLLFSLFLIILYVYSDSILSITIQQTYSVLLLKVILSSIPCLYYQIGFSGNWFD